MRKTLVGLTAAAVVGMGAPAAPAQSTSAVDITDGAFEPDQLEVRAGDVVRWENLGQSPHSVTSEDGSFDSGVLEPGQGFEVRFDTPGTYGYRSAAEGDQAMAGVVVVVPVDDDGSTGSDSGAGAEAPETGEDEPSGSPSPAGSEGTAAPPHSSSNVVLAQATAVSIQDDAFVPSRVEIEAGGTVVWEHAGQRPHTVTASDGSFDSGTLETGGSFSRTFPQPGTYAYYCQFHGTAGGAGMAGVVVVAGGAGGEGPPGESDGATAETGGLAATGISPLLPLAVAAALMGAGLRILRLARRPAARQ